MAFMQVRAVSGGGAHSACAGFSRHTTLSYLSVRITTSHVINNDSDKRA
jgi:hypothetical protein